VVVVEQLVIRAMQVIEDQAALPEILEILEPMV
jgi:hypothetical protein